MKHFGARKEILTLVLLEGAMRPMYGLDLIEKSCGLLKRGSVYVHLGRLAEMELVKVELPEFNGRRTYTITGQGRSVLKRLRDGWSWRRATVLP